jgi:hypothetical protein
MENKTDVVKAFHWLRAGMAALMALVVLAMFPYTGDPTGDIKWLLVSWGAFLLATGLLAVSWRAGITLRRPPALLEILLAFLAFNALAALRSDYFGLSMVDMRRYWALFLLYLVSSQLYETPAQVRRLILAICGAVFVAALYAFMQRAGLDFFPWADLASEEYRNLPATYGNPNFAAHTLILASFSPCIWR